MTRHGLQEMGCGRRAPLLRQALVLAVLGVATSAHADARWGLRWKAPEACVQPAELARLVEDRLGRAVFSGDAALRIDGVLEASATAPRWRARLTVVDGDGTIRGSREVTAEGESCRTIDENLALVVSVMVDPNAQVAPSAPPPPPAAPVAAAPPPAPGVFVRLEAGEPEARLFRLTGAGTGQVWTGSGTATVAIQNFAVECAAPCNQRVGRPADSFYVGGPGFTPSEAFSLHTHPDGVLVKAKLGSAGARVGGLVMISFGTSTLLLGLVLAGVSSTSRSSSASGMMTAGLAMSAGGVLLLGGGIPLFRWGGTDLEVLPLD